MKTKNDAIFAFGGFKKIVQISNSKFYFFRIRDCVVNNAPKL